MLRHQRILHHRKYVLPHVGISCFLVYTEHSITLDGYVVVVVVIKDPL